MEINLNRSLSRQLSNVYKLDFNHKYEKEIKDRLQLFLTNTYGILSLNELQSLLNEVEIHYNEITLLKDDFFVKYSSSLLGFFNANWFSSETEYKPTKKEEEAFIHMILQITKNDCISSIHRTYQYLLKLNHKRTFYDLDYFFDLNQKTLSKLDFKIRKQDIKKALKITKILLEKHTTKLNSLSVFRIVYPNEEDFISLKNDLKQNQFDKVSKIKSNKIIDELIHIVVYELMIEKLSELEIQ